ncbi:MAG: hypothetical protein ACKVOR_05415 [Flavobacteriales bacterium]
MPIRTTKLKGTIKKATVSVGSKSEHDSYIIEVGEQVYQARMKGFDAYGDDTLLAFLDKEVMAEGVLMRKLFLVHSIKKV